jgi:hypothetical protein
MRTTQQVPSFHLRNTSRLKKLSWLTLAAFVLILFLILASTTSFWGSFLHPSSHPAKAATPSSTTPLINVPFFTTAVPFNQTAIFWFGAVSSTSNYVDVRIGYNSNELYVDLQIVDRYLWYDPNTQAPNLNYGDDASIYLNTGNPGTTLDSHSYRFQAAVNGYKQRTNYQQAYTPNGNTWTAANIPFTATFGWRGHGFNGLQDRGWSMTYHIPFASLGISGAPSKGTLWELAVQVHNRDDAANTPIPDKWWPLSAGATDPSSWGDISFGMPAYQAPPASNISTYTVRNKLNNQVVTDGMVGGSLGCGNNVKDDWTQLENQSYPGAVHINIQNEADISDWNCFSKFYITFPLSSLPQGKGLISAKVTLYEYGNSGVQGQPNPSYIQVGVINQNWNPATLTWNNAPLLQENIESILVPTKSKPTIPWPGLAITWDVSLAAAQAYAAGQPLRLVFYSTDDQHNSGKYFTSSSIGDWDANGRPTLQVALGS